MRLYAVVLAGLVLSGVCADEGSGELAPSQSSTVEPVRSYVTAAEQPEPQTTQSPPVPDLTSSGASGVARTAEKATPPPVHNSQLNGFLCQQAGFMIPDPDNLCFVWFCEWSGSAPIKRSCAKGTRVPTWWEGGLLQMCIIDNIADHGGQPVCLRCDVHDIRPVDSCTETSCPNGCTCVNTEYTHRCDCPNTGVITPVVSVPFPNNYCEPNLCMNGASCQNQWDGYFCFCPPGWTGHRCEQSVCDWSPCENGGTCVVDDVGFHCVCDTCWSGPCCGNQVANCAEKGTVCPPCRTGRTCTDVVPTCQCDSTCAAQGKLCIDGAGATQCQDCDECFRGPNCKIRKDTCKCSNTSCPGHSRCEDLSDVFSHQCVCDECWTGANCDTPVKSCKCSNPCPTNSTCVDSPAGPTCSCGACMAGVHCDTPIVSCNCASPCGAGEACSMNGGTAVCSCADACMTGSGCSTKKNTCACSDPCQNGGKCTDGPNGPVCNDCGECYSGPTCTTKVSSCKCNNPCGADQVCSDSANGPQCGCPSCKTGASCADTVSSCACANPCKQADLCQDSPTGPTCKCDCTGNEICTKTAAGESICSCPPCKRNAPGQRGCQLDVKNRCECSGCYKDQEVCVDNDVESEGVLCKIGNPSAGNSFTVAFEENDTEKSYREIPLELYITGAVYSDGPRSVNIRSAGLPRDHLCYFNVNLTVPENDVVRFPVERCMRQNRTGLEHLAIRVTELNKKTMIVYGVNKDRWTADAFLAIPDAVAGKCFQTASYTPAHISTQFLIIALYDGTKVSMTLSDNNDLPAPYNVKGAVYELTMNAFDTFQVQSRCNDAIPSKTRHCAMDLSGTVITSDRPIHVMSGNVRAGIPIPTDSGMAMSRDHLVEEMTPCDRLGSTFGLITIPGRAVGDILHLMAVVGETATVNIWTETIYGQSSHQVITLPLNGKVSTLVEAPSNARILIKSDKRLWVTQMTKSMDAGYMYGNETENDPSSITVPPVEQMTNNFFFATPMFTGGLNFEPKPYKTTYGMLVAKEGEEGAITLNGKPLSNFQVPWGPVPRGDTDVKLVSAVINIPSGTNVIRNTDGKNFQCLVYGFDDRESYGLPAAMALSKLV